VQVVSESAFTVGGHGVHSAFLDHARYLTTMRDVELVINGRPSRKVDVVHVHTVGPYSASLLLSASGAKVASAHLVPESLVGSIVGATWLSRPTCRYLSWFYNRADLVVAVSEYVKAELLRIGVKSPIVVLPNWIACEDVRASQIRRYEVRAKLGLGRADTLIVSVGQLQPRKGVLEFLSAARQLPDMTFLWVGEAIFGAASLDRTELRRALTLAPQNVIHVGHIPRSAVFDLLAAADIYLSLSKQETFGIATLEAAAAGRPLVISDLPVFHGVYGGAAQYVPSEGPMKLLSALALSETLRHDWGRRAAKVADKYQWHPNGEALLFLYRSLLGAR
jgi:1,2-diacylglycerol-3-alpha-glucose alpha-1,2-galactosyltransferase